MTVVKQILSEDLNPVARTLTHSVLHQYTQLHINLTEDQLRKVPAVNYTFTFVLKMVNPSNNLIFAEAD